MTLREQRVLFTRLVARFILLVEMIPSYEIAFGEVKRSAAEAALNAKQGDGIKNSLHLDALAVDFDLYINGVYQGATEAHAKLGAIWKGLHPLCRWGGDFKLKPDGNHYSTEWQGRK